MNLFLKYPMLVHVRSLVLFLVVCSGAELYAKAPVLTEAELASPPAKIIRTCCSFGSNLGIVGVPFIKRTDITSLEFIGAHCYLGGAEEGNGIIYTEHGGFIDLGHVRDWADWTAYLYNLTLLAQENADTLRVELGNEGGDKTLSLFISKSLNKEQMCQLAGSIAYDLSLWHEISTWFGASYIPLVPERYSSFSPEDLYSNLLGVTLGINAIMSDLDYNQAMTGLITDVLRELESVDTDNDTFLAMEEVRNLWWSGEKSLPNKKILLKRYLDCEGALVPWLISDRVFEAVPFEICKPLVAEDGFYEFQVKANFKFPLQDIVPSTEDRFITQKDFPLFMAHIKWELNLLESKMAHKSGLQKARKERKFKKA